MTLLARDNGQDPGSGWTALHFACLRGNVEIVKELLKFNADVNTKDQDGDTALKYALCNGSEAKACARQLARVIKENKQREAAGTKPA